MAARTIYRAEVGIDRYFVNHLNKDNKLEPIKGFGNNFAARFDALVKTGEGVAKGVYATLAFYLDKLVEKFFKVQWQSDLWYDVSKKQFASARLCLKAAVFSPDKALNKAATSKTETFRNPYTAGLTTYEVTKITYPAGTDKLTWGTEYDPNKTTWKQKIRVAGQFEKPIAPAGSPKKAPA